jgi:hypothetical protein
VTPPLQFPAACHIESGTDDCECSSEIPADELRAHAHDAKATAIQLQIAALVRTLPARVIRVILPAGAPCSDELTARHEPAPCLSSRLRRSSGRFCVDIPLAMGAASKTPRLAGASARNSGASGRFALGPA